MGGERYTALQAILNGVLQDVSRGGHRLGCFRAYSIILILLLVLLYITSITNAITTTITDITLTFD